MILHNFWHLAKEIFAPTVRIHTYYIWCLRIDPYISKVLLWKCEKITIFHELVRCCTFWFFRSLLLLLCFFAAIWSGNGKYNGRNVIRIISAKYNYLRLWMTILNNFWKRIFCIIWLQIYLFILKCSKSILRS